MAHHFPINGVNGITTLFREVFHLQLARPPLSHVLAPRRRQPRKPELEASLANALKPLHTRAGFQCHPRHAKPTPAIRHSLACTSKGRSHP